MTMKMTMAEFVGLEPCPFCGGEAEMCHVTQLWEPRNSYWVKCKNCRINGTHHSIEAEAIAAWNTRAERTCECVAEYAKSPIDGKTIVLHRCSACHELMRPHMAYCPNCGARVISKTENVLQSSEGVEK